MPRRQPSGLSPCFADLACLQIPFGLKTPIASSQASKPFPIVSSPNSRFSIPITLSFTVSEAAILPRQDTRDIPPRPRLLVST
ncbi:hypothetical protein ACQRIU_002451 [Beauveria bassiana]